VRLLVTGGSGVLGRAFGPLARAEGHQVDAPGRAGLDLFDPAAVAAAVSGADAVLHLATRIPSLAQMDEPQVWRENDRLRAEASAILVDAARTAPHPTPRTSRSTHVSRARTPRPPGLTTMM
jgi:2-alkyl-3-oxoalkanoate reductase